MDHVTIQAELEGGNFMEYAVAKEGPLHVMCLGKAAHNSGMFC